MRIYLDNNATTRIHPEVLDAFTAACSESWANPSSVHAEGRGARMALEEAREQIAGILAVSPRELVFTSGGSESNNAALTSLSPGQHVVCSSIEHPSVLAPVRELERSGRVTVDWAQPDSLGVVAPESVERLLRPETALVIVMLANNETGVLQPLEEIAGICRARGVRIHCDAAQAGGRIPLAPARLGVDTLALAGHKMHAPKGVGLLYVREGSPLQPLVRGGAQERRRRAGTENVAMAFALAKAFSLAGAEPQVAGMQSLRDHFERSVLAASPDALVNGAGAARLPNTSNILFRGVDAETLVMALDLEGIAASTGSACSSGRVEPSHVLLAMGLSVEDARSSVRFSLSTMTTRNEIDAAISIVAGLMTRVTIGR